MPNDKKPTTTFQTNYELGVEFDPSGNVKKILVTDAKPEEQPAIDRHIENLRASAAPRGRPDQPGNPGTSMMNPTRLCGGLAQIDENAHRLAQGSATPRTYQGGVSRVSGSRASQRCDAT